MSGLTGAKAAKRAAADQAKALEEQTRQAQASANEAARQSSIASAQAAARDSASQQVEADALAAEPGAVEVDLTPPVEAPTRKRAKFNAGGSATPISI